MTDTQKPNEGTEKKAGAEGGVVRNAAIVAAFTLLSRVVALVRDQTINHIFGASRTTDVFYLAFTIPNVLRRLVGEGGVTVAFLPVYARIREDQGEVQARRFLSATFGLALISVLAITVLGIFAADYLVLAFASGFADEPDTLALAGSLTRWLFPYVYCISLVALAMGALNAHGHFAAPAAAPALLNASMVLCTLLFANYFEPKIYVLVAGVLTGGILQLLLQIPALIKMKILVAPRFALDDNVKDLLRTGAPALFGLAVYQLNIVILRQLASYLPEGQMTYYYNADRLTQFAFGVFGVAIATAALPAMSAQAARGDTAALIKTWASSTKLTNFVTIPSAFGLAAISTPVVMVLYRHGAFTLSDAEITASAVIAFAPWLIATACVRTTVQAFYALKDLRTPVIAGGISVVLTLGFGLLFLRHEVQGLCLALSAASWVQLLVLLVWLRRKLGGLALGPLLRSMLAQSALAIVAVSPAYAIATRFDFSAGPNLTNIVLMFCAMAVAGAIYAGGAVLFRFEEGHAVWSKLSRRFRRKRS